MKTNNIVVSSKSEIENLGSAITIEGLSIGPDGTEAYADWCATYAKFKNPIPDCYIIKGSVMNRIYHLTGDNAYQRDLNIVCFKLEDFADFNGLVMPRFEIGARWLDDIIANNAARESA